ncbi:AtpZ/AtpI family protein [Actinocorallia aurantiaca]|jgi:ATP synthase protein I|uniref:F0F1-ATPase subunit (Ca2+/Mg2+ transporter) n=1 Tax=Actinocorallia aurantiaca TaxID=46204 RepID=A0ABN3TZ94_9ACTN
MDKDTRPEAGSGSSNPGVTITSLLLSGMFFYGGIGWLVDRWVGTERVFLPIGIVLGLVAALYLVYVRFGRDQ